MSEETTGDSRHGSRHTSTAVRLGAAAVLALLTLAACASTGAAPQEAGDPSVADTEASATDGAATAQEETSGEASAGAEPEHDWKVDEETGKRYHIAKIPKGRFVRRGDGLVKPANMPELKVEWEDEEFFYIRVYEQEPVEVWSGRREATEADKLRYEKMEELPAVDTLRFVDFGEGLPQQDQWRNGFDLADINGDGHVDIIHGPPRKGGPPPRIFLGDDAGTWRFWEEAKYEPAPYDYGDVATADFNGDGRLDLALGIHLTGALVLVQEEAGEFRLWNEGIALRTNRNKQIEFSGREVAVHDWNGDGRPDLLVLSEGPAAMPRSADEEPLASPSGVRIYVNGGKGVWTVVDAPQRDGSFGDALIVEDLDGDGIDDIVTGSRTIGYHDVIKLGTEDGRWHAVPLDALPERSLVWSLAAGDFDGDGRVDLAIGYRDNLWGIRREVLDVLLNRSEAGELGWERRPLIAREGYEGFGALDVGDVDGDGNLDLVALDDLGETLVLLGGGDGSFRRELTPELTPEKAHYYCAGYEVRLRDLDGDGRDEIVAAFAGEPGGEQYLLGLLQTRCQLRGRLAAWKPVPGDTATAARDTR